MPKIHRALLSVTDKTGVVDFARALSGFGVEIVSTGGTYRVLKDAGIPSLREVADVTGFPEMLDGRVKTIHPRIAGGVLAIRANAEHMRALEEHGIPPIDLVCVNLYQFEKIAAKKDAPLEELIENIDIGGPTMIRAAAKNYQDVAVVTSPGDYPAIIEEMRSNRGSLSPETHWRLAKQAFSVTAAYDRAVSARLAEIPPTGDALPSMLDIRAPRNLALRYGENPHQSAALYSTGAAGIAGAQQLQGKELSYNNLVDLDAAGALVAEFQRPAVAIIKHNNPCGAAEQESLRDAYLKALECDPVSAYGGVLAFNRVIDAATAEEVAKLFVECIVAPGYEPAALEKFASKKNLRLLEMSRETTSRELQLKPISGGMLVQEADLHELAEAELKVATKRAPTAAELRALLFAWKVAKHVKSNAILFAREGQTVGVGAGQMSRVDSVKIAVIKAATAKLSLAGSVVASDAFFPFADGVEEAGKAGATAVIQPGGSVRDADVIAAANKLGMAMVFTGVRHFRH